MFFIVPTGQKYTCTVRGSIWKQVTCGTCRHSYRYQMAREASGTAVSPLWLDNAGAKARAEQLARGKLQVMLSHECAAVACPGCGSYQTEMVSLLRRQRFGWISIAGWFVVGAGILLSQVAASGTSNARFYQKLIEMPAVAILAAGLVLVATSFVGRHFYDPNVKPRSKRPSSGNPSPRVVAGTFIAIVMLTTMLVHLLSRLDAVRTEFSAPVHELVEYLDAVRTRPMMFNANRAGEDTAKRLGYSRLFASAYEEALLRAKDPRAQSSGTISRDDFARNFEAVVQEEQVIDTLMRRRERHAAGIAYLRGMQNGDLVFPIPQQTAPVPQALLARLATVYPEAAFDINDAVFAAIYRESRAFAAARAQRAGGISPYEVIGEFRRLIVESAGEHNHVR